MIDVFIFAPLAPILGVFLFWFLQLVFIESQKYFLNKINNKHPAFCRFTNFLGIFYQTICHALGYTVTRSGISEFYISVDLGRVSPKRERKGVFEWISNVFLFIGPFFIPAFLTCIVLYLFFIPKGFEIVVSERLVEAEYTFSGQLIIFGTSLYNFGFEFLSFLINLDLLHPAHLCFLLIFVLLGLGIRPSHIGEERREKVDIAYELRNIWNLIRYKPIYLVVLFMISYIIFYVSFLLNMQIYVGIFFILGCISVISIISVLISHLIILFIMTLDQIPRYWNYIPIFVAPLSYAIARFVFFYLPTEHYVYAFSILIMLLSTGVVTILLYRYKSDRFKTRREMKRLKKRMKVDEND